MVDSLPPNFLGLRCETVSVTTVSVVLADRFDSLEPIL
jgi:hypothetical protein